MGLSLSLMTGMPQPNPLHVAKESLTMAEKSGDRGLKLFGYVMLGITGLGTFLHSVRTLYRDWREDHRRQRSAPRPVEPPEIPEYPRLATHDDDRPRGKWTQRAELADREPTGEHAHAVRRQSHGLHR
jgi:hypothetical protein